MRQQVDVLRPYGWLPALFALTGLVAGATWAQDAAELLERMAEAGKHVNFDGRFIYQRGDDMDTLRIIHRVDADGIRERLVSLSGTAREVVRNGDTVMCVLPEDRTVVVERREVARLLPSTLTIPVPAVKRFYELWVAGEERIAGRPTWVVGIDPRPAQRRYRYGYRLWVDKEHALLLKSNIVDMRGRTLEQMLFTQIEFPETIPDALLEPQSTGPGFTWYEHHVRSRPRRFGDPLDAVRVTWLPGGFVLHDRERDTAGRRPMEHLVYSDGLATISVFVEPLTAVDAKALGFSAMGAVHAYSTVVDGHQVTVVGEVPPLTVRQVAASVSPMPGGAR